MTHEEESWMKKLTYTVISVLVAQTVTGIGILAWDHFRIQQLEKEMAEVRPRVEELWWAQRSSSNLNLNEKEWGNVRN